MTRDNAIGMRALKHIYDRWQIDDDRARWSESGFEWWPGHFKQTLLATDEIELNGMRGCRIVATTEVLRAHQPLVADKLMTLNAFAQLAPSYAIQVVPDELVEKEDGWPRAIKFTSMAFVEEDNEGWLPDFFGRMAILQPAYAQMQAEQMASVFGGQANTSSPRQDETLLEFDEMLTVMGALYIPMGEEPSRWSACDEFEQVAEKYGRSDVCFGNGDPDGLTLETPFGDDSALIQLYTDQPHPDLGNGLLATLKVPVWRDQQAEAIREAIWYNFFESFEGSPAPLLGSWCATEARPGQFGPAFSLFLPNALHCPGQVAAVVIWMLERAQWVRERFFPDVVDLTMLEIMQRRLSLPNE